MSPAVVIFGDGSKQSLKRLLKEQVPEAAGVYVYHVTTGAPRCELHCRESAMQMIVGLVPALRQLGLNAAVHNDQAKPVPKAEQATRGLTSASYRANMCRYFVLGHDCPFRGNCRFNCYPSGGGGRR